MTWPEQQARCLMSATEGLFCASGNCGPSTRTVLCKCFTEPGFYEMKLQQKPCGLLKWAWVEGLFCLLSSERTAGGSGSTCHFPNIHSFLGFSAPPNIFCLVYTHICNSTLQLRLSSRFTENECNIWISFTLYTGIVGRLVNLLIYINTIWHSFYNIPYKLRISLCLI